jgi:hypothetical protein
MATRNAAQAAAAQEAADERQEQKDINSALAATEDEIFNAAMGQEELENDGDRSLEDMGEGLEGEQLDEEDEDAEQEEQEDLIGDARTDTDVDEGEGEEGEEGEAEGELPLAAEGEQQPPARGEARVPSARLREEGDRARRAEESLARMERENAEMRGRLDELSRHVTQPRPTQQPVVTPPKPDMFSDPEGYERWLMDRQAEYTQTAVNEALRADRTQREQRDQQRVNVSLQQAAIGERSFEFHAAFQALTSQDPRNPAAQQTAYRIMQSADPAAALFDWWEENGGREHREQLLEALLPEDLREPVLNRIRGGQPAPRRQQQPRHEAPQRRGFMPSLNSARGGGRQQVQDPDLTLDGSEAAIFEYGARR